MDIDKWGLGEGGFVFLSHSHDDILKVRLIRNEMEENGFEPLCFYLKCLNKDSEIFDLIKREIDAREWFVYLKSQNSENSDWVKKELKHAQETGKEIIQIELDQEISMKDVSEKIMRNMRVFLSYSHRDQIIADRIRQYLLSKDLKVFSDVDMLSDNSFIKTITDNIIEASNNGCIIALITENSVMSEYIYDEIAFAIENKARIIPIVIGNVDLPKALLFYLARYQCLRFDELTDDILDLIYIKTKEILLSGV